MSAENSMPVSLLQALSGRISLALGLVLAFGSTSVRAQQSSARNVFWSASDLVQVSANPGAKPATNTAEASPSPRRRPATSKESRSVPHVDTELVAKNGYGEQPQLVRVSQVQIGLRYALLLRGSDGHYSEVSPTATFHNGDHLRLSIMANQPGYLYVIQKGSSGTWSPIFPGPSKGAATGEEVNKIEPGKVYEIPHGKSSFRFDQNPGEEKLFMVLSRERISDLDNTIKSLKDPSHPATAAPKPEEPAPSEALEASNVIPDAFVQRLASRDLTLVDEEDVDQPQKGDSSGEKAVYVVAKASYSKDESPRVVASVTLRHE
jgi:hypothetical protein